MLAIFLEILRRMKPHVAFIYGILAKWYIIILIPTILATYYVFLGLKNIGVFGMFEKLVANQLKTIVNIAEFCTPKILQIGEFAKCVMYMN